MRPLRHLFFLATTVVQTLLKIFAAALFTFMPMVATAQSTIEHDISVYAIGNFTTPSLGVESNDRSVIWQSNKAVMGAAGYFESWKHNNGLILGGSYTKTDSQINTDRWTLQRYKADAVYEHRFRSGKTFQPYLGVGGFLIILWGGYAPAHSNVNASGWDCLGGVIAPVGITTRLSSRVSLKMGLFVDIGKASSYGDPNYTPSQNLMYEPQIGLSFKLGNNKKPVG
jgi:hypothetical protein